jgi:hypothetical protein
LKLRNTSQETDSRKNQRVQYTLLLREPPHQRTTFRGPDRHLAKPEKQAVTRTREGRNEDPRRVLITRLPGERYTVPPSDRRDRRKPNTATGRFLPKKSQPRLIDLALNDISTGHSPTPIYLHEPATKSLCLHQQRQSKTKERKKKTNKPTQPPPVLHWEEETPTALKARRQTSTTGKSIQGEQNPGPNGQGNQKPKNKAGRRRREASPPNRQVSLLPLAL